MQEEMLPLLTLADDRILITGTAPRSRVHGPQPLLHATAVIAAVLPDGRILFADKTEKQRFKRRAKERATEGNISETAQMQERVIDIFGGHLSLEDITDSESFVESTIAQTNPTLPHAEPALLSEDSSILRDAPVELTFDAFQRCAARELAEELLLMNEDGVPHPYPVDPGKLIPLGFYRMENDHNRELSWAFLYPLPDSDAYRSEDTLILNGVSSIFQQPLLRLRAQEAIGICTGNYGSQLRANTKRSAANQAADLTNYIHISDGFSRIVKEDQGSHLLAMIKKLTAGAL